MAHYLVGSRRKTGQRWEGLLNLLETFLGKCRSVVKAGSRGGSNTRRKKGDDRGGTIRERRNGNSLLGSGSGLVRSSTSLIRSIDGLLGSSNGLSRSISRCFGELFVTIINNIVEPKVVGQRTGAAATRAAEKMAVRTVKRILVRILSNSSRW